MGVSRKKTLTTTTTSPTTTTPVEAYLGRAVLNLTFWAFPIFPSIEP